MFGFFILLQLYQPARNTDDGQVSAIHFIKVNNVPVGIKKILRKSCFDCHSNNTRYPWYSYLQPLRILMEEDIKNGKLNLNFSEWGNYSKRKQESKLDRIMKQIKSDEMPLKSYTFIHKKAILSKNQKVEVFHWIDSLKIHE